MASEVVTFRFSPGDRALLNALLARENVSLGEWIRRRIAEADAPAGAPAHVPAQARARDDEARALRAETTRTVTLAREAMAVLEHLFRQCVRLWPEYQTCAGHGFSQWLSDSAITGV